MYNLGDLTEHGQLVHRHSFHSELAATASSDIYKNLRPFKASFLHYQIGDFNAQEIVHLHIDESQLWNGDQIKLVYGYYSVEACPSSSISKYRPGDSLSLSGKVYTIAEIRKGTIQRFTVYGSDQYKSSKPGSVFVHYKAEDIWEPGDPIEIDYLLFELERVSFRLQLYYNYHVRKLYNVNIKQRFGHFGREAASIPPEKPGTGNSSESSSREEDPGQDCRSVHGDGPGGRTEAHSHSGEGEGSQQAPADNRVCGSTRSCDDRS